ncbi:MAG: GNAT family N-acetyltransferase [Eubacterium sp.]
MLELKKLSVDDGFDVYKMLQEIPSEENGLLNKANGLTFDEYKEWLIAKQRDAEQKGIVDGWKVPSTTFWLYADGVPVGFGSIRHFLTEALSQAGGHIGYGIAPQFRGNGYGNEILRLLLKKADEIGLEKVLVTVDLDNIASQAVALANGGVITGRTDESVLIWIDTKNITI